MEFPKLPKYNPRNWYWIVGSDTERVYSSAVAGYVPANDSNYIAWLENGLPATRIPDEANLRDTLSKSYPAGINSNLDRFVPQEVTMRQARIALHMAGKLTAVDAAIASLPEDQRVPAQLTWEYSTVVKRTDSLIAVLGPALGLSDQQIDLLFKTAVTL